MLPCLLGNIPGGDSRAVCERFIVVPGKPGQDFDSIRFYPELVMIGAKVFRNLAGIAGFIVFPYREPLGRLIHTLSTST